jgi:hypothetical protein
VQVCDHEGVEYSSSEKSQELEDAEVEVGLSDRSFFEFGLNVIH